MKSEKYKYGCLFGETIRMGLSFFQKKFWAWYQYLTKKSFCVGLLDLFPVVGNSASVFVVDRDVGSPLVLRWPFCGFSVVLKTA
jgi:hypothetical protein